MQRTEQMENRGCEEYNDLSVRPQTVRFSEYIGGEIRGGGIRSGIQNTLVEKSEV